MNTFTIPYSYFALYPSHEVSKYAGNSVILQPKVCSY